MRNVVACVRGCRLAAYLSLQVIAMEIALHVLQVRILVRKHGARRAAVEPGGNTSFLHACRVHCAGLADSEMQWNISLHCYYCAIARPKCGREYLKRGQKDELFPGLAHHPPFLSPSTSGRWSGGGGRAGGPWDWLAQWHPLMAQQQQPTQEARLSL